MKAILVSLRSFFVSLILFVREPKKIKILGHLTKGVLGFIVINSLIKVLEYQITRYYDPEHAVILMFITSLLIRSIMIVIYDLMKIDWLLIEYLKEKLSLRQELEQTSSITRKITRYKKIGNNFLIFILVLTEPVLTVLVKRKGHHIWNTIPDIKTLILFTTSVIICTATLTTGIYSFFALKELLIELISQFRVEINVFWIILNLVM